ncbi:MAG: hypothetical protein WDA75_11890, partial [Candidatus Latescibacterota bacterium]
MRAKRWLVAGWAVTALLGCDALKGGAQDAVKLETEDQKLLYSLGLAVSTNSLSQFKGSFTDEEVALIEQGFGDGLQSAEPQVALN